ncbi:unnamed protein product [Durusdinium trenchii]|uniref:Uncharacterized protein n=2 Tax=Durusdinium trenchii TaxID=1381693 RepID=A0ABP0SYY6_9DINO
MSFTAPIICPWSKGELDVETRLEEIFQSFQEPHAAVMNASHLADAMRIAWMNPTNSEVSKVLADLGRPESLTMLLFKQVMKEEIAKWSSRDQVQELLRCFQVFDPRNIGFVPRATLAEIMEHGGNHFSEEMLEDMLKNVPQTSEGYDYRQIVAFLLGPEEEDTMRGKTREDAGSSALAQAQDETILGEAKEEEVLEHSQASLREYFENGYKQGGVFNNEDYEHDAKAWCWVHTRLGVKVWQDALDLTLASGASDVQCLFHYTAELGFRNITDPRKAAVEVFASLITQGEKANAWWGQGVYSVQNPPDEWPEIEALIDNNYRNMLKRDIQLNGREAAMEEYSSRVAFCIPILVNASIAYDVSKRQTPEMVEQGKPPGVNLAGKLLNEDGMPHRQCIVIRVEREEAVANASAVLVKSLRCRAEAITKSLGSEHSEALKALSRLATVLAARSDFTEAEPLQRRVLEAYEAQCGNEDLETLREVKDLAEMLLDAGNLAEAERLSRRALAGRETQLGSDHEETLDSVNILGLVLSQQGTPEKLGEAEVLYKRALEGRESLLGPMHPDTLQSVSNLALLLDKQGKQEEAEPLFWRDLKGCEARLGATHPDTLISVNNLAGLLQDQGKLAEAELWFRRALQRREDQLGAMHADTLTSLNNLAAVLKDQGDQDKLIEAAELYRRALEGREALFGPVSQDTLSTVFNLAKLLEAKGSLAEAEDLYVRHLKGLEELYGPNDQKVQVARRLLERFLTNHSRSEALNGGTRL